MRIAPFFFSVWIGVPLFAAISGVSVSTTNTQGVLHYTAPGPEPCQVAVSELADFSKLANDVDPAKFPGAAADSRAGSVTEGAKRTFVIGKRAAERGADHVLYSRALQALTHYHYRIACGTDSQVGEFTTANLAMGNSYTEPQPVDREKPGEYAWPSLALEDRTHRTIDPQTGLLIRRVTLPGDRVITEPNQAQAFQFARSTTWSDAKAALAKPDAGAGASIGGNNTGTLLLTPQNNEYAGYISFLKGSYGANHYSLNSFQVVLTASTDAQACDSAGGDDCKLVVCLSIDGIACYSGARRFDLALNTKHSRFTLGTAGKPIDLWQTAGNRPPNGPELATRIGRVTCDGSANVNWASGDVFGTHWSRGSTITINAKDYTVDSLSDTRRLVLTSVCPKGDQTYAATNFGVLFRKKTASANHVIVESAVANYQLGVFPSWDFSGDFEICADHPVNGPGGRPGYNCVLPENGLIYWIDAESGEAHLFARYMSNGKAETKGCGYSDSQIFDSQNPDIWYCGGSNIAGEPQIPYRVHYFGNHEEPRNTKYPTHFEDGENLPECSGAAVPANQPCLQYSALTGTVDMGTLTATFDPTFQKDRFRSFYLVGLENGIMVFRVWRGAHNSIGWTVVYDPNALKNSEAANAGCLGNGQPGCVIAALPSWSRKGLRWCPLKGNNPMSEPGWLSIGPYIWAPPGDAAAGVGPYQSDLSEGTRLSKTLTACPPNRFGAAGDHCSTVRVSSEPRDASPCVAGLSECGGALETGAPGELQLAEPGDEFTAGPAGQDEEIMRLIAKGGPDQRTWTFERGITGTEHDKTASTAVYAFCAANPEPKRTGVATYDVYWNYGSDAHGRNTDGNSVIGERFGVNAHMFIQGGMKATGYTEDPRCAGPDKHFCYQVSSFTSVPRLASDPPNGIVTQDPPFTGKFGVAFPNQVQQHPSGPGVFASAEARRYFFDGRPFNGSPLSGSIGSDGAHPAKLVAPDLYQFTAQDVGPLDRKYLPTFAFAGSKPLLDISGPKSHLNAEDKYRYCVAAVASECRPGSAAGDVFVSAPFVTRPFCHHPGQASGDPDEFDLCIGNNAMVYNSLMQIKAEGVDNAGTHQRMVSKMLARNRLLSPFWHSHTLANGTLALVKTEYVDGVADMVLSVHLPPPPPDDNIERNQFQPVLVKLQPPPAAPSDTAYVEFGYGEYSTPDHLYCTSRAEECAVFGTKLVAATPFLYAQTEASKLTGVPCAAGCTVAVPAISQRVLYARGVFRDATRKTVVKGPITVVATP